MTPTHKLRFVERFKQIATDNEGNAYGPTIRVLQQWWEDSDPELVSELNGTKTFRVDGEWRDVPVEKEQ